MSNLPDSPLDTPGTNPVPPRRPNRKRTSPLRSIVGLVGIVFLAALAGMAGFYYKSHFGQKYGLALLGHPSVQQAFPGQSAVNMMIIGRDYDYNDKDQIIKSHARSDLLMEARIDFAAKTVRILSIPRDTRAYVPGHGITKINAAHAFGGPELSAKTVQNEFSIPTDHYAALDFSGFEQAIDLLGGVDLVVDKKMDYDDNWGHLHIHLKPGYQHLNGKQAIGFVRFRHSDSDLIRTHRQQTLLAALKLKLLDPRTFVVLPNLMDTLDAHLDSDLNVDQKVALAYFLKDVPKSEIAMTTLPSIEGGYYVEPDWPKARPLISNWFGVAPRSLRRFPGTAIGTGGLPDNALDQKIPVALVARPAQGGIRSHLVLLSRHLDSTRFLPRLLAPQSLLDSLPRDLTENGSVLDVAAHLSLQDPSVSRRLRNLVQSGEIVHAHGIRAGWICALAREPKRCPLVVTFHNVPPPTLLGKSAVEFICRRADRVIAVSQAIAASLPRNKTRVIPNGIEIERFQNADRKQSRLARNLKDDAFVVGCIARLSREKGVDLLVEAARQCPEMHFIVAGDGPERTSLGQVAPRNLQFLGQVEDVAPILKALDVVVIPSRSEGQGIVALEAFASGCPVLAARVGGLVQTVQDGRTGVFFEPEDSISLKHALKRLASDARLRDVLRVNALAYVRQTGRVEQMCRATEAVYREIAMASE